MAGGGGRGPKILLETGDYPEKEGIGGDMGSCHFFISLQFDCIYYECVVLEGVSKGSFVKF